MITRYKLMKPSEVMDTYSYDSSVQYADDTYPDVLSVDYTQFTYTQPAVITEPVDTMLTKPWYLTFNPDLYNSTDMDDILYNIVNIPHRTKALEQAYYSFPVKADIMSFIINTMKDNGL